MNKFSSLPKQVKEIEDSMTQMQQKLASLEDKVDDFENRSRRNNLIIYGLKEPPRETPQMLQDNINEILENKLGIRAITVERCHRLGRIVENKDRPVILKFIDYREKMSVLKVTHKLKGSVLSFSEDFSYKVREAGRNLWKSSENERENGAKVKLLYNRLSVDGNCLVGMKQKMHVLR